MASYMPQDVFDMCVVSAVKIHMVSGDSLGQVCSQICGYYKNSYPHDADFELEIKKTSGKLLEAMRSQFEDEQLPPAMTQLQYCITNYELNGKKKRKRLLSGTLFTKTKSRNPNRAKGCLQNMTVYHVGTMTGDFPVAPTGWSLENR